MVEMPLFASILFRRFFRYREETQSHRYIIETWRFPIITLLSNRYL